MGDDPRRASEARLSGAGGYTFGDSDLAARRLALVAAVFAKTTRQFLLTRAGAAPGFAIDLGCGPGYTTELIRATVGPRRLLAVDSSPAFVAAAAKRLADDHLRVLCTDALDLPDEVTDADLIFARMLLTHLRDPLTAIEVWRGRLSERGRLLLEEVDSIATEDPTLAGYLDLQREMLAANDNLLDIGPRLDAGLREHPALRAGAVVEFSPPAAVAARMFAMNLVTWRERPEVTASHDAAELDAIAASLERIAQGEVEATITWRLRHLVLTAEQPG
ncbi:MAG TPA: class I SAM-dependent methyltransferase [Solirubrobacterales bacterium]|nr:class I SAM-dependent methyltransferase [Solirubrobacterales bacterium]